MKFVDFAPSDDFTVKVPYSRNKIARLGVLRAKVTVQEVARWVKVWENKARTDEELSGMFYAVFRPETDWLEERDFLTMSENTIKEIIVGFSEILKKKAKEVVA